MNVFMIGGTGLLGSEAARELIKRGHSVTSMALPPGSSRCRTASRNEDRVRYGRTTRTGSRNDKRAMFLLFLYLIVEQISIRKYASLSQPAVPARFGAARRLFGLIASGKGITHFFVRSCCARRGISGYGAQRVLNPLRI